MAKEWRYTFRDFLNDTWSKNNMRRNWGWLWEGSLWDARQEDDVDLRMTAVMYMHLWKHLVVLSSSYTGEDLLNYSTRVWNVTTASFLVLSTTLGPSTLLTTHAGRFNHSSCVPVIHFVISSCRPLEKCLAHFTVCLTVVGRTQNCLKSDSKTTSTQALLARPLIALSAGTGVSSCR